MNLETARSLPRAAVVLGAVVAVSGLTAAAEDSNWPSFRGPEAAGVADGQNLPEAFDAESGRGIRWRYRVPGLAHSSPVIWDDRLFVTSAVSAVAEASFRPGLYGDGDASEDRSKHRWMLYCFDKRDGHL